MNIFNKVITATALSLSLIGLAQTANAKDIATVKSVEGFTWETAGECTYKCGDTATATATSKADASGFVWETTGECSAKCDDDDEQAEITSATMK